MFYHGKNHCFLLVLLIFIVTLACQDDEGPCADPKIGPTYLLSDTIKDYFSNYYNAERLVFLNSSGEERLFELSDLVDEEGSYFFSATCEADSALSQSVQGVSQLQKLSMSNDEISEPIFLYLQKWPEMENRSSYESIAIYFGELSSNTSEGDGLLFYNINEPSAVISIQDTLNIAGKLFFDVIELDNPTPTPNLDIKMTKNEGIVYIKNSTTNETYVYDRKE